MFPLLCSILALADPAPAHPPALTADFDGDGKMETATARWLDKSLRLEIADAKGKRLASVEAPAPPAGGEAAAVHLESGALGSPGILLEVVAASSAQECRSVWRFRGGALARLPKRLATGTLPDCGPPEGWTARWEKAAETAPAVWVRERARETSAGLLRQREVFAFTGFALEQDPNRSSAQVSGVAIPSWNQVVLYTRTALEILKSRFDLSGFRAAPRLRIETNRDEGVFALRLEDRAGPLVLPVVASGAGAEPNEVALTVVTQAGTMGVRAIVRNGIVTEVRVTGLSRRWDALYLPANRFTGAALEIFGRAEEEITSGDLIGLWSSDRGEKLALNAVAGVLGALDMRGSQLDVSLDPVPAGSDVLLVPRDGSAPAWAFTLKGPNGLARLPVRCTGRAGSWSCAAAGPAETFHRVGGRVNAP